MINPIYRLNRVLADTFNLKTAALKLCIFLLLLQSCTGKIPTINDPSVSDLPTNTVKNFRSEYFENNLDTGKLQIVISSPLLEAYSNKEPSYLEFTKGIQVIYFEGTGDTVASAISKYAKYDEEKRLWELRDSVVVRNDTGNILETELLYWDQEKDLIFTEKDVRITSTEQVVMGSGFESDSKLNRRVIKNITGSFYIDE